MSPSRPSERCFVGTDGRPDPAGIHLVKLNCDTTLAGVRVFASSPELCYDSAYRGPVAQLVRAHP